MDKAMETDAPRGAARAAAASGGDRAAKKRKTSKKVPKQHRVGNFRSYYTFRLGQACQGELEDDPRLSVLEKAWFCGKRGLDIGCNSGDLTIAIAKTMEPAYVLGIDVDATLVSRARTNLKELLQHEQVKQAFASIPAVAAATETPRQEHDSGAVVTVPQLTHKLEHASTDETEHTSDDSNTGATGAAAIDMPLSFRLWKPPVQSAVHAPKALGRVPTGSSFPANVVFKREDIVTDTHAGKEYDFITCFSVTKWIHLFHGDEGIKRVFAKIYALLAPGGRFIVEPQPWKSYHKRKFTSDVTAANYGAIALRPKDFPAHLVDAIGFKTCTFLQVCRTSANGFRRPVYVLEK